MIGRTRKNLLLGVLTLGALMIAPTFAIACELPSSLESKADSAINSVVKKANGSESKLRNVVSKLRELERKYSKNAQATCLIGYLRSGIQKEIDGISGADDILRAMSDDSNSSSSNSSSSTSSSTPSSGTSGNSAPSTSNAGDSNSSSNSSSSNSSSSTSSSTPSSGTSGNSAPSTSNAGNKFEEAEANWRAKIDPKKTSCDPTQSYTAPSNSSGQNFVATGDCSKAAEIVQSKCWPESSTSYTINGVNAFWIGSGVMYPNGFNVVGGSAGSYSCTNWRILYKCALRAFKCTSLASTSTPVTWKRCGWLGSTQYHCAGSGPARGEQISCPVAPPIARKVGQNVQLKLLSEVGHCTTNGDESCSCTYNASTSVSNWQENSWTAAGTPTSTSTNQGGSSSTTSSSTSSSSAGTASISVTKSSGMWLTLTINGIGQNVKQCIAPGINAACTPSDQLSQGGGWTYYASTMSWKFDASVVGIAEPGQYYTLRYLGDNGKTANTSVAVSR